MSSGEESDIYRQLQETGDIYRSRYEVSCVTVLLRKLAHNAFHFQIILLSRSGHSIYNSDELIPLEFINFNRKDSLLPREAFSISKAKTLKLYAMNRLDAKKLNLFICLFVSFVHLLIFEVFQPFIFHLFITSTLKIRKVYTFFYLLTFF